MIEVIKDLDPLVGLSIDDGKREARQGHPANIRLVDR